MQKRACQRVHMRPDHTPRRALLSARHDSSREASGEPDRDNPAGGRQGRAGIRDVAAAAGVSITTVSDALNGKGRLPDATRRHVREVADRLGYRPSAAARTLRTGKSGLIGLTVTTYGDEPFTFTEFAYFAEMARAATSAALARGYALVILPATSRHDVWSNVALDGTVVIDPSDHDPVVTELVRQGLPVVSDGRPAGSLPVTAWVDNDHEAAVLGLLDHLAAAGARRIGLLTGTTTDTYTRLSTTAYLNWCERVGQDPVYESYPAHDPCAGAVAADRLLARPDRPDAVYGLFDPNGTDLLAAARRYGLRVPRTCCSCAAASPPCTPTPNRPSPPSPSNRAASAPPSCSCSSTPSRESTPDAPSNR